ncbi:MAG: NAD+ synthase [Kiritimatiellae bacterium]|nr:NAD+ synthase [Kiritimatiellia bacterium]
MNYFGAALVQVDVAVGALEENAARMIRAAAEARGDGAAVIVFPELCLSGYPPEDLVLKKHFLENVEVQLQRLAREVPSDAIVVAGAPRLMNGRPANTAVVLSGGRIVACYRKMALPNYGVFDEKRVFSPGDRVMVLEAPPLRLGLHICEDSWVQDEAPCTLLRDLGLDALLNLSASPYHRGKLGVREETLAKTARLLNTCLLYCNLVGGQDELVFDGGSMAIGSDGSLLARARTFEDQVLRVRVPVRDGKPSLPSAGKNRMEIAELPTLGKEALESSKGWKNRVAPALDDLEEVYAALKLGLRDYVQKNGFNKVVVALSGGIDSALVATLAADALGPDRVAGVTMPSAYSSPETQGDAGQLAKNLGIEFHAVPIRALYDAYVRELAPLWEGRPADITEENLQARIRGNIVMALSNKFGWLVLATGNKSEIATGYCTLYGDMVGGFAVIKDVPKTLVFELARWRNGSGKAVIPPSTIERPPTAELRPGQKDTDSLPPYDLLDPILERYIERDLGFDQIVADGFDPATVRRVIRMVDANEYKRRQGAPGIKITPKAFGRDRRMPITNRYRAGGAES